MTGHENDAGQAERSPAPPRDGPGGPSRPAASATRTASDGARLFVRDWRPPGTPLATLLVLHGVAEHGGRYGALAARLVEAGVAVRAHDQRGHGRSDGPRGHVDDWSRYLVDAVEIQTELVREIPAVPRFVFGQSMGSLLALELAMRRPIPGSSADIGPVAGWIVSGVGVRPHGVATPGKVALARLLSRLLPRLRLDLGISEASLSRDPEVGRAYREDPLVFRRATVRWGAEGLRAIERVKAGAGRIREPLLILHGEEDPISDVGGARWLARAVSGPAELHVYPGVRHEPHHDADGCDPLADVVEWVTARIARPSRV